MNWKGGRAVMQRLAKPSSRQGREGSIPSPSARREGVASEPRPSARWAKGSSITIGRALTPVFRETGK